MKLFKKFKIIGKNMSKYLAHRVYNMFKELRYFIRGQKNTKKGVK